MEKCIGCELCAGVCPAKCIYVRGRRQPARRPGVARRALRLHLRDQLPAVHPLRPVRRGVPDRGDHRVEAVRVQLHRPPGRHLHQGRAGRGRRRSPQAAPLGGLVGHRGGGAPHLGVDAGHRTRRAPPPTRAGCSGPASSASACGPAEQGQSVPDGEADTSEADAIFSHPGEPGGHDATHPPAGSEGHDPRERQGTRDPGRARRLRHRRRRLPGRRAGRGAQREPGPRRAVAGGHAVRHRGAVRRPGGQLPGRGAGHRLRGRHRGADPVRAHAARRRPGRGPADRAARRPARRRRLWCRSASWR